MNILRRIRQLEERQAPSEPFLFLVRSFEGTETCRGEKMTEAEYRKQYDRPPLVIEIVNEPQSDAAVA